MVVEAIVISELPVIAEVRIEVATAVLGDTVVLLVLYEGVRDVRQVVRVVSLVEVVATSSFVLVVVVTLLVLL